MTLKILRAHPKALNDHLLSGKYSLLYIYILLYPQNNKHLKDKKAWSVHIYCMGMTSFKFLNCVGRTMQSQLFLHSLRME